MAKTKFERLKERIKKDTGIELNNFKRTYVGIHERCSGAFVWVANNGNQLIGSTETATNLLKSKDPLKFYFGPGLTEIL